ncbi:unnamed protein product [Scytosiphon promiscuus]
MGSRAPGYVRVLAFGDGRAAASRAEAQGPHSASHRRGGASLRLIRVQDAGKVVPPPDQGQGGRETAAAADARRHRDARLGHRLCHTDIPHDRAEEVHHGDANALQRRHTARADVFVSIRAHISKYAGGIGVSIHDIRGTGSYIRGTGGKSSGIVPMLRMFKDCSRFVDQAGRRKGSFAFYSEPWHADIRAFLDMKKNTGNDLERARDLFFVLWVPDLFMKRVESNRKWSLFSPDEATGLSDVHGGAFEDLYTK